MQKMLLVAAVALVMPVAALADPPAPAVESAGAHPGEPLICQYYYHEGQVVRRPVCKTEREWIRYRIQQQADVRDFQLKTLSSGANQ